VCGAVDAQDPVAAPEVQEFGVEGDGGKGRAGPAVDEEFPGSAAKLLAVLGEDLGEDGSWCRPRSCSALANMVTSSFGVACRAPPGMP
jgi:hypothetical protein